VHLVLHYAASKKKIHYFFSGSTLIALGILPILYDMEVIGLDITLYPIFNFAAYFFVVLAAKDLFKESFKEKESTLKWPSLILAISLLVLTTIPTLNKMHVIEFVLNYPKIIDHILYLVCGLFLIISIFTLLSTEN